MTKIYTITKDGIRIRHFKEKEDRDKAFGEYVLPNSNNCLMGEMDS